MNLFSKKCKTHFSFLIADYGCSYEYKSSMYGGSFYYKNDVCCIKIMEEREDLFISLAKLKNGEIPEYSSKIGNEVRLNFVDLLTIIKFKKPDDHPYYSSVFNKNWKKLDFKLKELSTAVKLYTGDIIKGDFSYFEKLIDSME